MIKLLIALLLPLCLATVHAASLPAPVADTLKRAKVPLRDVGILIEEVGSNRPLLNINTTQAMNPASVMKLLTTYAALETLGPAYRWKTEAYLDGKLDHGVLQGNLVFKGYGDPKLTLEQFWIWLRELRQRGLHDIRGDIVLDTSLFADTLHDAAQFDNQPERAYNVGSSALLLNFNALHLRLIPNGKGTTALLDPELAGYPVQDLISTSAKLGCNEPDAYTSRIENHTIVLAGQIPANCGESDNYVVLLPQDEYFFAVFTALWRELGGTVQGKVATGSAPANQAPYAVHQSAPLAEAIRDINKFSNNVMARQLFLTLGANNGHPANIADGEAVILEWLHRSSLDFPELVLENGAGLSRTERISARHLADLLQQAARGRYAAELEASLPILGIDGTVKKRFRETELSGYAHLKTGTLDGVKSIAGYIKARSGKRYILAMMVNHPNAGLTQPVQDTLLEWLYQNH
jgi:D-alanyl-D-alanine carboxypeptidase/D-alanyl-D-alanine-endopeptidase (penicillin-binding protein 4)